MIYLPGVIFLFRLFLYIFGVSLYSVMKLLTRLLIISFSVILIVTACKKDPPAEEPLAATNLISNVSSWNIASVPLRFPESNLSNNIAYGFNRAKIAWYNIDPPVFYNKSLALRPPNITKDDMSADDCRVIWEEELFPSKENPYNESLNLNVFNIDYYPSERGSSNYDTQPSTYSAGIASDGTLNDPATRWAGIVRKVEPNDHHLNYLDFWILDPFTTYPDADGELVFDMGEISEDVLKDGKISAEYNTEGQAVLTAWGLVKPQSGFIYFPADHNREKYDTGLDELQSNNENSYEDDENNYFKDYLFSINTLCNPLIYNTFLGDPSGDDYHSFLGEDYDQLNYKVRDRYKKINSAENNSPINGSNSNSIGQRNPNTEDINYNLILDTLNNYREYKIQISKEALLVGSNYVVEIYTNPNPTKLENGSITYSKFYHFRIPLKDYTKIYGTPVLTANPAFIRLYFTGFTSPFNLRFINLMFTEDEFVYTH